MSTVGPDQLTSMPVSSPRQNRLHYLRGDKVEIDLYSPSAQRHRKLDVHVPERLLKLYTPDLASTIVTDGDTGARLLRIAVPLMDTVDDVEIPGLKHMIYWITNLMHGNQDWNTLPSFRKVEQGIPLLRACEMLGFEQGASYICGRIEQLLTETPLTADGVRLSCYVFSTSKEKLDRVALNLANLDLAWDFDDIELITWFLTTERSYGEYVLKRIQHLIREDEKDREEEQWQKKQGRILKIKSCFRWIAKVGLM